MYCDAADEAHSSHYSCSWRAAAVQLLFFPFSSIRIPIIDHSLPLSTDSSFLSLLSLTLSTSLLFPAASLRPSRLAYRTYSPRHPLFPLAPSPLECPVCQSRPTVILRTATRRTLPPPPKLLISLPQPLTLHPLSQIPLPPLTKAMPKEDSPPPLPPPPPNSPGKSTA